jgi:hypothetical protein
MRVHIVTIRESAVRRTDCGTTISHQDVVVGVYASWHAAWMAAREIEATGRCCALESHDLRDGPAVAMVPGVAHWGNPEVHRG